MAKVIRKKGAVDFQKLKVFIDNVDGEKLQVGWFESARYDANTPVAGVVAVQEFGSPARGIPPRPFMRPTIEEHKGEWGDIAEKGYRSSLVDGTPSADVLNQIGLRAVGQIKKAISTLTQPPLSPVTLALRKQKLAGKKITGSVVGATAAAVAEGKTGAGELGDSSGVNDKPLVFTSLMFTTLTHEVSDA